MAVNVDFYTTTDDPRVIGKTLRTTVSGVTCKVWEPCTLTEPILLLDYNDSVMASNYCHIGAPFNRYYFMGAPETQPGGKMTVPLMVDVRQTWADDIKGTTALVTRSENDNHGMIVDDKVTATSNYKIIYMPGNYPVFTSALDWSYVLEVNGK